MRHWRAFGKKIWMCLRIKAVSYTHLDVYKRQAVKSITDKIAEIKKNCEYEGFMLPISPITNILQKYCNELENSTDYEKMTILGTGTMVCLLYTSRCV